MALQPSSLAMGMTATLMFTFSVSPPRVSASSRRDESELQCMPAMPLLGHYQDMVHRLGNTQDTRLPSTPSNMHNR